MQGRIICDEADGRLWMNGREIVDERTGDYNGTDEQFRWNRRTNEPDGTVLYERI